ncbi:OmpA family protein [Rhabdochromatium marinum]|uniref:OmpA family protein n=1 Tax=Rhabdochromatium marinum TaxID=48729 RepID=UPI001907FCC7
MSNVVSGLALGLALLGAGLLGAFLGPSNPAQAEEYMKRGASVDDYQQALGRVLERKRGIVTARERQQRAAAARPAPHAATGTGTGTQVARPQTSSTSRPAGIDTGVYSPTTDQEDDTSNGLSLYFGYNSAELTAAARDELRKLGQALSAPEFAQVYWLIEGHTDATGAADYNQQLSEARAASARRFLIEQGGIAPDQLITVGKGESELYDAQHPTASVNRRVRLRPIGEDRQPSPTDATAPSAEDAG